jgi:hypothetical protein
LAKSGVFSQKSIMTFILDFQGPIFTYNIFLKYTFFIFNLSIKNTKKYTFFSYDLYYNYLRFWLNDFFKTGFGLLKILEIQKISIFFFIFFYFFYLLYSYFFRNVFFRIVISVSFYRELQKVGIFVLFHFFLIL